MLKKLLDIHYIIRGNSREHVSLSNGLIIHYIYAKYNENLMGSFHYYLISLETRREVCKFL